MIREIVARVNGTVGGSPTAIAVDRGSGGLFCSINAVEGSRGSEGAAAAMSGVGRGSRLNRRVIVPPQNYTNRDDRNPVVTLSRFTTSTAAEFLEKKVIEGVDNFWMEINSFQENTWRVFGVVAWPWQIDIVAGDHNSGCCFTPVRRIRWFAP